MRMTRNIKGFPDHAIREYARIPQIALLTSPHSPRSPRRLLLSSSAPLYLASSRFPPKTITLSTKAQLARYNVTAVARIRKDDIRQCSR